MLFEYAEKHTQDFVKRLFHGFTGYLQCDASNVYDVLERGPPKDTDEGHHARWLFCALPALLLRGGHL